MSYGVIWLSEFGGNIGFPVNILFRSFFAISKFSPAHHFYSSYIISQYTIQGRDTNRLFPSTHRLLILKLNHIGNRHKYVLICQLKSISFIAPNRFWLGPNVFMADITALARDRLRLRPCLVNASRIRNIQLHIAKIPHNT